MEIEKIHEILKTQKLTLDEIQDMMPDHSVYEISRYIITNPSLVQQNQVLCDNKIRFTHSSNNIF